MPHKLAFSVLRQEHSARAGLLRVAGREVCTPMFMPVATRGALRWHSLSLLKKLDFPILLNNFYHLRTRAGMDRVQAAGGIGNFIGWNGLILTDSGGFQAYSFADRAELRDDGVYFRDPNTQEKVFIRPEDCVIEQSRMGSNLVMPLDVCVPAHSDANQLRAAMQTTHQWLERAVRVSTDLLTPLFGIVQGGMNEIYRRESAEFVASQPVDGIAIGGVAVGDTLKERNDVLDWTVPLLPPNRPRYLMGVGTPLDILHAIDRGIDLFDCILPTKMAERGVAYTHRGLVHLRRTHFSSHHAALDTQCLCSVCQNHSIAYLHYLYKTDEPSLSILLSEHNLTFYRQLVALAREAVLRGDWKDFRNSRLDQLGATVEPNPPAKSRRRKPVTSLGNCEIVQNRGGAYTVQDKSSGETMHSVNDPTEEALAVYWHQSRIFERANEPGETLVVWDVGLGSAFNAMSLLNHLSNTRPVQLISFENNLSSLRLVLKRPDLFPHIRSGAPHDLLTNGEWKNPDQMVHWKLLEGDFLEQLDKAPLPSVVAYDPFSPKVDATLWSVETFERLFRKFSDAPVELYTYSQSTKVRSALLYAGFFLARGIPSGPKESTTIAMTELAWKQRRPGSALNAAWFERWERSAVVEPNLRARIRAHRQYQQARLEQTSLPL